jgi:hypothetical protein
MMGYWRLERNERMKTEAHTPSTATSSDEWLSEPAIRRRLGYSRSTFGRFRNRGLPHVGDGRLRRYSVPVVLEWLQQRTTGAR